MRKYTLLCAAAAIVAPAAGYAQSTGTVEFEEGDAIVVTGTRQRDVAGIEIPDTSKSRQALNAEFIQRQTPGQTIMETINNLPGVSFTNNDPFGSAGGALVIRGFDNSRISQTFDGLPTNDTGNYALYSQQQVDPEVIEQVNVSLGSTDVDSPTAAATGSTVNIRTRLPFQDFSVRVQGSYGIFEGGNFFRPFASIDTGAFGPFDTRAFVAASTSANDLVYGNRGKIFKKQINGRIYQPLGANGDFLSLAGHFNVNRNNSGGSAPLRTDLVAFPGSPNPRIVGSATANRFPLTRAERDFTVARCQINQVAQNGVSNTANTCGSDFEERYNPSDTGNIRAQSRFTLAEGLVLTVEPSYQYSKANGGGTVVGQEGLRDVNPAGGTLSPQLCVAATVPANASCQTGYIAGIPYYGRDLNGDGDRLDTVRVVAPSQTVTKRLGVISGLRYEINDAHSVRVNYSFDRGRHRQTGETGLLQPNGEPFNVFPVDNPLADVNGNILQKRDRFSIAQLHQLSGEYRGEFLDGRLTVNAGIRAPFFKRELNNFCAATSASGFVECFGTNSAGLAAYLANNPTQNIGSGKTGATQAPQRRVFKYDGILPNVGAIFDVAPRISVFANYSRGLQVPRTDSLYNSFFYPIDTAEANPEPETTDNFDVGVRYRSGNLLAQLSGWYTIFKNRLAEAFDPDLDQNVFRNLGTVHKYGLDGSVTWQVDPSLSLYVYGSYLKSEIKDDVLFAECGTTVSTNCPAGSTGKQLFAPTAGRRESGAPIYTLGARVQAQLGPLELGVSAKRTGPRYINDVNQPIFLCINPATGNNAFVNGLDCPTTATRFQVYGAKAPAYNIVNLDLRLPLEFAGLNDRTFLQLNITNLFDVLYANNRNEGQLLNNTVPFVNIGAPRAAILTLAVGF